ncbi:polysaccharide biosynthesis protein [Microbacterium sp. Root180]|uniref:polysaccharide biosynthesis protein n=1 Tax=Microbacterium sp. Root180 TaxID=1736483 RepID=UPI0006F3F9E8|nr:nucleoside-diphosphate sugar epimerase/dehydratase [Microbacterium sp. Root180]KRB36257.1 capsule biosynthesis protein CapD [Microbacterium sp. Root180]
MSRMDFRAIMDCVAWFLAVILAVLLRYEFDVSAVAWLWVLALAAFAAGLQALLGWVFHVYRGRFGSRSLDEVRALVLTLVVEAVVLAIVVAAHPPVPGLPRSTVLIALPLAAAFLFLLRYAPLFFRRSRRRANNAEHRVIVFGAGSLGQALVRTMANSSGAFAPVGFVDDDPRKRNLRVSGVPVLGTSADLARVAEATEATDLVVAIGRADAALLRQTTDAAEAAGLTTLVFPELDRILSGASRLSDLRSVSIEDLIGRQPVETDISAIAGYITGQRILVTGAGGSIGSELCRQIAQFGPGELIMLDRDETGLQQAQLGVAGHGLLNTNDVVLADIRDEATLRGIFDSRRPQVVFHAAALKHLPMLEQYPDEAWKTNVIGTLNVIAASRAVDVTTFVNISTDKAANPTSVLGHSKRVAEKLTAWAATETGQRYLSVRFGNVIGSRGSMLPTFQRLIELGGPITITHPEVSRYFMTIPEACQLVVQAGGIGRPGEVLILDMGEPVRILDVARRMIAMSGQRVDIVFTGLRDGEKLHEELVGASEETSSPFHPMISHAKVGAISPAALDKRGWESRLGSAAATQDPGTDTSAATRAQAND